MRANLFPIGFTTVFWISYCPDRGSSELLETVFEHFVAPNSVLGSPLGFIPVGAWLANYQGREPQPTTLPPSGLRPDGGRVVGKGVVGSQSVNAPLAQGQLVAEQVGG